MKYFNLILVAIVLLSSASTAPITTNGSCGPGHGKCGPGYCCSQFGYCGKGIAFCGKGCQSEFGKCYDTTEIKTSRSKKNRCGPKFGYAVCSNDECCNKHGYCGKSKAFCGKGCQSEFGRCNSIAPSSSSLEGRCGPEFGNAKCSIGCCSKFGYCGITDIHCLISEGCQSEFGKCNGTSKTETKTTHAKTTHTIHSKNTHTKTTYTKTTKIKTTKTKTSKTRKGRIHTSSSTSTQPVVGRCGPEFGNAKCGPNNCCSKFGYCGISDGHCLVSEGCQSEFGSCINSSSNKNRNININTSVTTSSNDNYNTNIIESKNEKMIWNFFMKRIGNPYGVAGIMGNLFLESSLRPDNLEDIYEGTLNSDREYTKSVNRGSYKNFAHDEAGYGLAQWTYHTRKQALLDYAKKHKAKIDDLKMQLDFLWYELTTQYGELVKKLKNAKSVKSASNNIMFDYERPVDQGEEQQKRRANYGQIFFNKYAKQ